jgi:pimeloyl-ACP methyl ester carboxylesterase
MNKLLESIFLFLLLSPVNALGQELYEQFPAEIHANQKYVFYVHGLIVEGDNQIPEHPEFGIYDFPSIKMKLFEMGGFNLIAHHRPKDTDVDEYADLFASWIDSLLESGVPATNITLIGFSRGSHLTALTADRFNAYDINTVLMAGCVNGDMAFEPPISLSGRLLSIYETTDTLGPCQTLASRSQLKTFDEHFITTGLKHGAFYTPLEAWLRHIREWIK